MWWLARTEPRQERLAKFHVERDNPNAEAYLPCFWDPFAEKIHPLFPNYLFVRSPDGLWGFLRRTIGIFSVVMRGSEPDIMPDVQMEKLREREYQGLVQLQEGMKLVPGRKVEIGSSWNGIYTGMSSQNRCRVLLSMFGRQVTANVEVLQVRPV